MPRAFRVLIMAEMHGRDLLRRHVALLLLVALPLAFYLSSGRSGRYAVTAGGVGMAFAIAGATLSGPSSIDFVLRDRRRIRAKLDDDCPALDFYSGFYLQANEDELICAKREMIRSRIGGSCRIARFRRLEPQAKR